MNTYNYLSERHKLFTDEGQRLFLKIRDHVQRVLKESGSITGGRAMAAPMVSGDSWLIMACVDRMIELGELRQIQQTDVAWQNEIFVSSAR